MKVINVSNYLLSPGMPINETFRPISIRSHAGPLKPINVAEGNIDDLGLDLRVFVEFVGDFHGAPYVADTLLGSQTYPFTPVRPLKAGLTERGYLLQPVRFTGSVITHYSPHFPDWLYVVEKYGNSTQLQVPIFASVLYPSVAHIGVAEVPTALMALRLVCKPVFIDLGSEDDLVPSLLHMPGGAMHQIRDAGDTLAIGTKNALREFEGDLDPSNICILTRTPQSPTVYNSAPIPFDTAEWGLVNEYLYPSEISALLRKISSVSSPTFVRNTMM